jgi:malyl-CoA/(S)-citramalyl-CoA lyase
VPFDRKKAARAGLIRAAQESDFGSTSLWTRINAQESPWVLDDLEQIADKLEVVMCRRSRAPGTSTASTVYSPSSRRRPA